MCSDEVIEWSGRVRTERVVRSNTGPSDSWVDACDPGDSYFCGCEDQRATRLAARIGLLLAKLEFMARLAHFGTFDVANYGDLLFPLIAEYRLRHLFGEIVHVSPVGGRRIYSDVNVSCSVRSALKDDRGFDGVLVGGGNILHAGVTELPDYEAVRFSAYPDLWMAAAQIANSQGIPLAFNAPGAPSRFLFPDRTALKKVLQGASYLSVRDARSASKLPPIGTAVVNVVPDSALQISEVIPFDGQNSLDAIAEENAIQLVHGEYVAVHVNSRYGYKELPALASELNRIADSVGLPLCLIAIGPCHGDDELLRALAGHLPNGSIIFDQPKSVTSIAHAIAGSRFYVGSSLHGFITATSFGVPAYLVVDQAKQFKFSGLVDQLDLDAVIFGKWSDFVPDSNAYLSPRLEFKDRHPGPSAVLDAHWASVTEALSGPAPKPPRRPLGIAALRRVIGVRNRAKEAVQKIRS